MFYIKNTVVYGNGIIAISRKTKKNWLMYMGVISHIKTSQGVLEVNMFRYGDLDTGFPSDISTYVQQQTPIWEALFRGHRLSFLIGGQL